MVPGPATTFLSVEDCRAERAEEPLHATTQMLSSVVMQAVNMPAILNVTEVLVDGKSILRLNNPISLERERMAQPKP